MNKEISGVAAAIVIVAALVLAGIWIWRGAQGTTFTKSSVRGIQFDVNKAKGAALPSGR